MRPPIDKKRLIIKSLVIFCVGLIIAFCVMSVRGVFEGARVLEVAFDGFFVAAVALLCIGLLVVIAKKGEYDALGFLTHKINPFKGINYVSYADYKEKREKQREENPPETSLHFFIASAALGIVTLILAIIFYS